MKSILLTAVLALAASGPLAAPSQAAPQDPLFTHVPVPPTFPGAPLVPPLGYFTGPCGAGADSAGNFYVSDYYHDAVDVFEPNNSGYKNPSPGRAGYLGQIAEVDAEDGPCGLAFDAADNLYVNDYHRRVIKFAPQPSFGSGTVIAGQGVDATRPTGVAVDPGTGNVYVDARDHVAVYDSSGTPVPDGPDPLRIGLGTLEDGYGLAYSSFPGSVTFPTPTAGYLYVPDAGTNTVKVFDPAVDKVNPVDEIDASDTPAGKFVSLRDAAIAVDRVSGEIYVSDNTQPFFVERPQAIVYVFDPTGAWKGQLKYKVVDGRPVGLAVDNSATATQGRVYVTSGAVAQAGIYAYPPGAATASPPLTPSFGLVPGASGGSATTGAGSAAAAPERCASGCGEPPRATASELVQDDNLRVSVSGKLAPKKLPRKGRAPISVAVGWSIDTTDGSPPPKLRKLRIEINRGGRFDPRGLPVCPYARIQPASTRRALANCRRALVGKGTFAANIAVKGDEEERYETSGRLLVFNGKRGGVPVLYGQIYAARPFATSFVITFEISTIRKGAFGTALTATLPATFRRWGDLTGIQMKLSRRYRYRGQRRSYVSAGCPAPKGFGLASFKLARASFSFTEGRELTSTVTGSCRVQG